jgi:ketosteroid isomerase-like protein
MKLKMVAALLFITAVHVSAQKVNIQAEKDTLMKIWDEWPRLAATGETDKILTYWAEDAIIMQPGRPTISGIKDIRTMIEMSKQIPGFKMEWDPKPISIEVSSGGDMAYIIAKNKLSFNDASGKPVSQTNRALLVWKKQSDKSWKEEVVMFNADPAAK